MHANFMKFSENYFGALSMSQAPKVTAALSLMKWLLAIVMTGVVTIMLLFLAGVFHSKVPSEVGATSPVTLRRRRRPRVE